MQLYAAEKRLSFVEKGFTIAAKHFIIVEK